MKCLYTGLRGSVWFFSSTILTFFEFDGLENTMLRLQEGTIPSTPANVDELLVADPWLSLLSHLSCSFILKHLKRKKPPRVPPALPDRLPLTWYNPGEGFI